MEETLKIALIAKGAKFESIELKANPRGLVASKLYPTNTSLIKIPLSSAWSHKDTIAHPILSKYIKNIRDDEDSLLLLLLMYYKLQFNQKRKIDKDSDDIKYLHMQILPLEYTNSIFLSELELDLASGSSLHPITLQLQSQIIQDYNTLNLKVFSLSPLFQDFSLDLYKWSLCTMWSRCMDFIIEKPPQNEVNPRKIRLLVPFIDLINCSLTPNAAHILNLQTNEIIVTSANEINQEITIDYGEFTNLDYFRLYGFVFADNNRDFFQLVIHTDHYCFEYTRKVSLFKKLNFEATQNFKLRNDKDILDVVRYLIIQRVEDKQSLDDLEEEVAKGFEFRKHLDCVMILEHALKGLKQEFKSKEALRIKLGEFEKYSVGWNCVYITLNELNILECCIQSAETLLKNFL